MATLSQPRVRAFFREFAGPGASAKKGRALENAICYIFGRMPGIRLWRRNKLNAFQTEEVDVAFWNDRAPRGLHFLPNLLLVECKNWSQPVGSAEVAYFASRLRHRGCDHGVLVAANGVAGEPQTLTAAHYELAAAQSEGQRILLITRQELESLSSTTQLVRLIQGKLCELVVSGTMT